LNEFTDSVFKSSRLLDDFTDFYYFESMTYDHDSINQSLVVLFLMHFSRIVLIFVKRDFNTSSFAKKTLK